jgi:hypothetical protein
MSGLLHQKIQTHHSQIAQTPRQLHLEPAPTATKDANPPEETPSHSRPRHTKTSPEPLRLHFRTTPHTFAEKSRIRTSTLHLTSPFTPYAQPSTKTRFASHPYPSPHHSSLTSPTNPPHTTKTNAELTQPGRKPHTLHLLPSRFRPAPLHELNAVLHTALADLPDPCPGCFDSTVPNLSSPLIALTRRTSLLFPKSERSPRNSPHRF